jgi:hypothetical protein
MLRQKVLAQRAVYLCTYVFHIHTRYVYILMSMYQSYVRPIHVGSDSWFYFKLHKMGCSTPEPFFLSFLVKPLMTFYRDHDVVKQSLEWLILKADYCLGYILKSVTTVGIRYYKTRGVDSCDGPNVTFMDFGPLITSTQTGAIHSS